MEQRESKMSLDAIFGELGECDPTSYSHHKLNAELMRRQHFAANESLTAQREAAEATTRTAVAMEKSVRWLLVTGLAAGMSALVSTIALISTVIAGH